SGRAHRGQVGHQLPAWPVGAGRGADLAYELGRRIGLAALRALACARRERPRRAGRSRFRHPRQRTNGLRPARCHSRMLGRRPRRPSRYREAAMTRTDPRRGAVLVTALWSISLLAALAMAASVAFRSFTGVMSVDRHRVERDALFTAGL